MNANDIQTLIENMSRDARAAGESGVVWVGCNDYSAAHAIAEASPVAEVTCNPEVCS
jgi:hypothetical protein